MVEGPKMSSPKEEILSRIRRALKDVPEDEQPGDVSVKRTYRIQSRDTQEEIVHLFAERVREYKAQVSRISSAGLPEAIAESCKRQHIQKLVIPAGLPEEMIPDNIKPMRDEEGSLTYRELDVSDGVLTTCTLAVAETGTIILDCGAGQGRRALTLLPDYHLCVVHEDQITGILPEAIPRLDKIVKEEGSPITFISGPSATSDIELSRVEGVHGPRRLEVLIVSE